MKPEVYKLIRKSEALQFSIVQDHICKGRVYEMSLPTELVIHEPGVYAPCIARSYHFNHYLHGGEVISYDEVCAIYKRLGLGVAYTSKLTWVYLHEVWEDCGSDGHVEYELIGYTFSILEPKKDYRELLDYMREIQYNEDAEK